MKRQTIFLGSLLAAAVTAFSAGGICAAAVDGKSAFDTYCSGCHPQGRNPQNPAKSLLKIDREANGIRSASDIIRKMRKPGTGMRQFDKNDIPDTTAAAIAEYIINTFK